MNIADARALRSQIGTVFATELEALRRQDQGIVAAQVCTADGFAVAAAHADEESGRRLAAIVSSLHALGVAVVEDLQLGKYSHLSIEASAGKCILFELPSSGGQLLLAAVADNSLLWGQLLSACRGSCESLDLLFRKRSE